ncbi:hypothetical protein [Kitasatospora griseola]
MERADRAIRELVDVCHRLGVPGPTDKMKDALRSSYGRTFTTGHRSGLGVVVTVVLLVVTAKAGWSWLGDAAAIARNPHPRPYQHVVLLLCFVPMVVASRHTRFDPRPDRASRMFARAVVCCAQARSASPADQDRCMRTLQRRLNAVDQLLQSVRSRFNTHTSVHKMVWPARARLLELQGRLDTDPDQALKDLAETLMTVAGQYVARNFANLLDRPAEPAPAGAEAPAGSRDRLRRVGTVVFAGAWIWWASGLPLAGWSQVATITVGPFLAFVLFYGVQLGFGFLDRFPGFGGQQEPAAPGGEAAADGPSDASGPGPSEGRTGCSSPAPAEGSG